MPDATKVRDVQTAPSERLKNDLNRVDYLRWANDSRRVEMGRTRAIMDGGKEGLQVLLGNLDGYGEDELSLVPTANLMLAGIDRFAHKLGRRPDLNVLPPVNKDTDRARKRADKMVRIVESYDDADHLEMLLPQVARWMVGYGFAVFTIVTHYDADGHGYPRLQLRDPYDTYLGAFGVDQQPQEVAFVRSVPIMHVAKMYPRLKGHLEKLPQWGVAAFNAARAETSGRFGGTAGRSWANRSGEGVTIVELVDHRGTHVMCEDIMASLEFTPNQCATPPFRVIKRFSFNDLRGQFEHVIGLASSMAKMNLLVQIAAEDAVFTEALALDTPIPTPTGWTTMGEIEQGDMVLGADGLPAEVIAAKPVQTDRDCYRVIFQDGTSVVASDGHLWSARRGQSRVAKIFTTEQMATDGRTFRVPAPQPWKLPDADLPIDPYVLGVWLGDGRSQGPIIAASADDMPHVVGEVVAAGYEVTGVAVGAGGTPSMYVSDAGSGKGQHGSGLHGVLRELGLLGNKHVPDVYLRGSIDQRLSLLQGLMDTDGTVGKVAGNCSFTNTNRRIIDAVLELLRSLGEIPTVRWQDDVRARNGGYWSVYWTTRHFIPFRMARKAEMVHIHKTGKWVRIKSVEPAEMVPVRCIAVANNDHLFLAGPGGHVTHNTNVYSNNEAFDYEKGRDALNFLGPPDRVERPTTQIPFQLFQHIGTLERMLRSTARYSAQADGESPNSFATGAGLEQLASGFDAEIKEYFTSLRHGLEQLDHMRLEFDKHYFPYAKPMSGVSKGEVFAETYNPGSDIVTFRTRRTYGAMSGFDEPSKIATMLNLNQAGFMSQQTGMENLDGIENVQREKERILEERSMGILLQGLEAMAGQGDPKAMMALTDLMGSKDAKATLLKFFTPEGDELSPEEEAMANPQPPPELLQLPGTPPDVATVLARATDSGADVGVQRVGTI